LTDPALMLAAARIDSSTVLMDTDLLGRLLDTFVLAQLRPDLDVFHSRARIHHLRTDGGRQEVDVIIDLGDGRIVGIEVKAHSAPTARDARHLVWLRDELGDAFVRGIVFHTGPQPFELGRRIWALPIAALWGHA
jgi:predicted AAA+ superfamily ATPase